MPDSLFYQAANMRVSPQQAKEIANALGVKDVTNIHIINALKAMGVNIPDNFDTTGKQHSTFKDRLKRAGVTAEQFSYAEKLAGWKGENVGDIVGGPMHLDEFQARALFNNYGSVTKTGQPLRPPPTGQPGQPGQLGPTNLDPLAYLHPQASAPAPAGPPQVPIGPAPIGGPRMRITGPAPAPGTAPAGATKPAGTANRGAGGGGGGGGGPTTNALGQVVGTALGKNATDAQVEDYFRKNYGAEAWMLTIPDFKDIIRQVALNPSGWSLPAITSAIQSKPWWQANGSNVADFLRRQANDPIPLQLEIKDKADTVRDYARTYGMTLSDDKINQIATDAMKWGWKESALHDTIAQQFDYQQGQHTVFTDQLMADAKNYLVPLSEGTIDEWGKRIIASPEAEKGNWQEFLKEQAKSMFPSFAARLDGGEKMSDIAQPYANIAAQLLELDPKSVDFTDPKWMAALDKVDDKGNHTNLSYADWGNKLKNDSQYRYDFTDQAKQAGASMATDILKKFGAIAG